MLARQNTSCSKTKLSLLDVLSEVGRGRGLKDVKLEEPDIEEVIRTFYQNKLNLAAAT